MVSNALRHADGTVVLRAAERDGRVELHVLDEGTGSTRLPAARVRALLARGPRASGRGAGLGLSIVRAIAEAHGGQAHARNRPIQGADVWLQLPGALEQRQRDASD